MHHRTGKDCGQRPLSISAPILDNVFSIIYMLSVRDTASIRKLSLRESSNVEREKGKAEADITRIESREEELSKQKARLITSIAHGTITEGDAAQQIAAINQETLSLEKAKTEIRHRLTLREDRTDLLLKEFGAHNFRKYIHKDTTDRERRDMLRKIVSEWRTPPVAAQRARP